MEDAQIASRGSMKLSVRTSIAHAVAVVMEAFRLRMSDSLGRLTDRDRGEDHGCDHRESQKERLLLVMLLDVNPNSQVLCKGLKGDGER